jgi:hypothetical protein
MDLSQLAASEQQLWDAFPRGEWIDFRGGNPSGDAQRLDKQREIRAEVVRALLLGACVGEPGYTQAVRLRGARIVGKLDLTGAVIGCALVCEFCYFEDVIVLCDATSKSVRIEDSRFPGLDGTRLRAEGILSLRGSVVTGIVRLNQANVIGQVSLRRTAITPDAGEVAASAEGLTVEGYLDWEDLKANGLVDLSGARISGSASFNGACILRPGKRAFFLSRAVIGGKLTANGVHIQGETRLHNARISGNLQLSGAVLSNPGGAALNAGGVDIRGGMFCVSESDLEKEPLVAEGRINLIGSRLGDMFALPGARLSNSDGTALILDRTEMRDCLLAGLVCTGRISLVGAKIASTLNLDRARLELVDLGHTQVDVLRDDPESWPEQLNLNGLTYRVLEPPLPAQGYPPARGRLEWLDRDQNQREPQPYEQLAASYAAAGRAREARRVLYWRERRQYAAKRPFGKAWSLLQDKTVGYGYQPWRAALWLSFLLLIGSIIYTVAPPAALQPSAAPHFNPVIYTLDLLLPIVDLGQRDAFNPSGAEQWLSYFFIAAGWILATTAATGVARILKRQ